MFIAKRVIFNNVHSMTEIMRSTKMFHTAKEDLAIFFEIKCYIITKLIMQNIYC